MDAEDFTLDYGSNAQIVKHFCAILPGVGISVLSDRLIIKAVDGSNLTGLVVASEECNVGRVLEFEAEEELESLDRVVASVHEVTHENVSSVWNFTTLIK